MDTEREDISSGRKPKIIALIFVSAMFLAYYLTMAIMAPAYKMRELRSIYGYAQDEKNQMDSRILYDSTYMSLSRQNAFLKSRIRMAGTDSVCLSVNIPDSTISLEISGAEVYISHMSRISVSDMIWEGDNYVISSMLSEPLTIIRNFSTIEKEPLMKKMAPRDTSEYVPDIIPDTADYEPVNFILETDRGIRFHVYQEDGLKAGDMTRQFIFDVYHRFRYAIKTFIKVITFRIPDYQPYIKIRIPRTDAKIIYRALPENGQIALYS